MDCPFSQNRPIRGSCNRDCAMYDQEQGCLIAQALRVYIAENTRVDNEDEMPWEPDWGGVE